jgi:hypothetical protein
VEMPAGQQNGLTDDAKSGCWRWRRLRIHKDTHALDAMADTMVAMGRPMCGLLWQRTPGMQRPFVSRAARGCPPVVCHLG